MRLVSPGTFRRLWNQRRASSAHPGRGAHKTHRDACTVLRAASEMKQWDRTQQLTAQSARPRASSPKSARRFAANTVSVSVGSMFCANRPARLTARVRDVAKAAIPRAPTRTHAQCANKESTNQYQTRHFVCNRRRAPLDFLNRKRQLRRLTAAARAVPQVPSRTTPM